MSNLSEASISYSFNMAELFGEYLKIFDDSYQLSISKLLKQNVLYISNTNLRQIFI